MCTARHCCARRVNGYAEQAFQMSATQGIRLASFAAVVFLVLHVTVIVCQNADISGCADSKLVNSLLTLNCRYIGKREEYAIFWYNGSNSDILALRPRSNVPDCDVFARINISFDSQRISYTCNAASNIYTLTINPLLKQDNNVTWSCTFVDPEPNPVKAVCIIHVSETTEVTAGVPTSTVLIVCIAILVVILIVVAVITVVIIKCRKRKRGPDQIEKEAEVDPLKQELAGKAETSVDSDHDHPVKESETELTFDRLSLRSFGNIPNSDSVLEEF